LGAAVRSGSLRALRDKLDRKKFAVCSDARTGLGLLHVASGSGHADVARYLATNFDKTLHIKDFKGRTPLHFAAVCAFHSGSEAASASYRMLVNAGAEEKIKDEVPLMN